jgi:hypothetical protein
MAKDTSRSLWRAGEKGNEKGNGTRHENAVKYGTELRGNMHTKRGVDNGTDLLTPSLEERLRHVRECCRLLGDFFGIQAEAAFLACETTMSMEAYNALTGLCHAAADELERLVQEMPPALANWHAGAPDDRYGHH